MGGSICVCSQYDENEAGIVSSAQAVCANSPPISVSARELRVLTLTPFYPHAEKPAEGCFVAEVLPFTQRLGIANDVVAVRPFYRGRIRPAHQEVPCVWKHYSSLPGNLGLPLSGSFLAANISMDVLKMHQAQRFDLIHAHGALPCGYAAAKLSERLNIPFIVSVHGLDAYFERQGGPVLGIPCRSLSAQVYRHARAVVCVSEKVRAAIGDDFVNTTVIHNGVDAGLFSPGDEQKSPLLILSVGNLIPIKEHTTLIRAFAEVLSSVPDCELEIIGDGPERRTLTRLSEELGISNRVHFRGQQSREAVAQAMARCAVFGLPSSYEALGCVYLEAMSAGKPTIACEGQGIGAIIQHGVNGLLVTPGEEQQLSNGLRMLLQKEEFRRRLGRAARSTVLQAHTLAHQAAQLNDLYRECLQ